MKKYFWSLLPIMMVAMLSVSIVSCSKDDDDKKKKTDNTVVEKDETNPLIGNWYSIEKDEEYEKVDETLFVFMSNGKFKLQGHNVEGDWNFSAIIEGKYDYYDEDEVVLLTVEKSSHPDISVGDEIRCSIIRLTQSTLVIQVGEDTFTCSKSNKTSL